MEKEEKVQLDLTGKLANLSDDNLGAAFENARALDV